MHNGNDGHCVAGFVDSVDDPVGTSTGAVSIREWLSESLPDPAGVVEQWSDDELVGGEGHRLRKLVGQLASGRGRDDQFESFIAHPEALRRRIASTRDCSVSPSPRASSVSEAASCRSVSVSERIAIVSSNASRSSGESRIADGRPWTVTVTLSCWLLTRPTSSDR